MSFLPKISTVLQGLKFTLATVLELSMEETLLPKVINGTSRFTRHFAITNAGADDAPKSLCYQT